MDNNSFTTTALSLYKENKWREILELNENSDNKLALNLLWVWPSEDNLRFIKYNVLQHYCKGIISIGCGCGLLEWILQKATDLPVIGYEVNENWWKSKYSNPQFIELNYYSVQNLEDMLNKHFALLFCYFNNREAFLNYVSNYEGNMIIIIGPGDGRGTHTDPSPFKPNFENSVWKLLASQEVKNTKDFIAIYIRC